MRVTALVLGGLCVAVPAAAQMQAVPLATIDIFQRRCADLETNVTNFAWCSAYIVGYADAMTAMLADLGRPPLCLNDATVEDFVASVLRYILYLGKPTDPVAPALQAAVATAMQCQ